MWNKVVVIVLRIAGILLVFAAPIIHLTQKYRSTTVVTTTENSMPMLVLLLVSVMALGLLLWVTSSVRLMYIEELKRHPFGAISVITVGTTILAIAIVALQWLRKLSDLVNHNAELFAQDITVYSDAVQIVAMYVGIGLACTVGAFVWRKATE